LDLVQESYEVPKGLDKYAKDPRLEAKKSYEVPRGNDKYGMDLVQERPGSKKINTGGEKKADDFYKLASDDRSGQSNSNKDGSGGLQKRRLVKNSEKVEDVPSVNSNGMGLVGGSRLSGPIGVSGMSGQSESTGNSGMSSKQGSIKSYSSKTRDKPSDNTYNLDKYIQATNPQKKAGVVKDNNKMDIEYVVDDDALARDYQQQLYNEMNEEAMPSQPTQVGGSRRPQPQQQMSKPVGVSRQRNQPVFNPHDYLPEETMGAYDDELQRAIQESLLSNKPTQQASRVSDPLSETMNDETYQKALEKSKKDR